MIYFVKAKGPLNLPNGGHWCQVKVVEATSNDEALSRAFPWYVLYEWDIWESD